MLQVHFRGSLTADNTVFDEGDLQFPLGHGHVIKGWDQGLLGMKVGETRKLVIPPSLAYGEWGTPGGPIPKNAELTYLVSLKKIVPDAYMHTSDERAVEAALEAHGDKP